MNRPTLLALLTVVLWGWGACAASTARAPFFILNSPDHPRAWYVGNDFDKLSQSLRWSEQDQSLSLDIAYTLNGKWPQYDDPELYNGFTVRFPAVRRDPGSRELYFVSAPGRRTFIGSVQFSFLGKRVVLDRNVEVRAHRRNGVIDAALVIYPPR